MNTWHIHIKGRVQGVGFRPYVYRLARERKLNGIVYNSQDGIHIEVSGFRDQAKELLAKLIEHPPALAKITDHHITQEEAYPYKDFRISQNQQLSRASLMLPPDFALCESCRREVNSGTNRRAFYPFITCTECGPRYSIIKKLPFERTNTAMEDFEMCGPCNKEYKDPKDRRYHSQTNSCYSCGIKLRLFGKDGFLLENEPQMIVEKIAAFWKTGKIVAIKGIGGYLLTCDATNEEAVRLLRKRKNRRSKPFACMYPDVETIQAEFQIDRDELPTLTKEVAPILLLKLKTNRSKIALREIAPGLDQIGVMIPYTPLYELLLRAFGKPIVATSGNLSNASIVFEEDKVLSQLSGIWDYVLSDNREIVSPQDDSVMRYTRTKKQAIIIRRSRGLAPNYFGTVPTGNQNTILALGAAKKSVFGLLYEGQFYLSQYLGNLAYFESTENFKKTIRHYVTLLKCTPKVIITDKHPDYYSTQYGEQLAKELGATLIKVQHHYAHFAALLSEHDLINGKEKVLGVVWDGLGYGDDKNSWGGEFFTYWKGDFNRVAHLPYSPHILGDKMALEPRISALAYCSGNKDATELIKSKFTIEEWQLYHKILGKRNSVRTSSMGRMFDAVASLLGVLDIQTYEGEAALKLETLAQTYADRAEIARGAHYILQKSYIEEVPKAEVLEGVVADLNKGVSLDLIAFKFHFSLVKIVEKVAKSNNARKIAFSGGVFQNGLLVDLMMIHLGEKFQLHFHEKVSPNDENIALGQLAYYQIAEKNEVSQ